MSKPGSKAQPRWVEGELLQFSGTRSPLTGGAGLGFVWSAPGERRLLVLLSRLDLAAATSAAAAAAF